MANLICEIKGARGRSFKLYDTKCVITTEVTIGSILVGNATNGEKTIFLTDVIGVQFKKSGWTMGYLQFETASSQMKHSQSNFFSENSFTFENGLNGVTNELMQQIYEFVTNRVEELKYNTEIITEIPDFKSMIFKKVEPIPTEDIDLSDDVNNNEEKWMCPECCRELNMSVTKCRCGYVRDIT